MTKPDTVLHASLTGRRRLVKESVASSTNVPFGASCSIRNKRSVRTCRGWCCGSFGLSGHIGGRELVVCALRTYKKQFTILMYHNSIYLYKKCIFPQTQIRGSRSRAALKVTWTVAFAHPVASYHGLTGDLFILTVTRTVPPPAITTAEGSATGLGVGRAVACTANTTTHANIIHTLAHTILNSQFVM